MSLNYDTRECDIEGLEQSVIDSMIWITMAIDVGQFTAKNVDEIYDRIVISEALYGKYLYNSKTGESVLCSKDMIRKFIGLRTNVRTLTMHKWLSRIAKDRKAYHYGRNDNDV